MRDQATKSRRCSFAAKKLSNLKATKLGRADSQNPRAANHSNCHHAGGVSGFHVIESVIGQVTRVTIAAAHRPPTAHALSNAFLFTPSGSTLLLSRRASLARIGWAVCSTIDLANLIQQCNVFLRIFQGCWMATARSLVET